MGGGGKQNWGVLKVMEKETLCWGGLGVNPETKAGCRGLKKNLQKRILMKKKKGGKREEANIRGVGGEGGDSVRMELRTTR